MGLAFPRGQEKASEAEAYRAEWGGEGHPDNTGVCHSSETSSGPGLKLKKAGGRGREFSLEASLGFFLVEWLGLALR